MVKKLNFVKLAGMWFAHIPDWEGGVTDLTMVDGADTLCDLLNWNSGLIATELCTSPDEVIFHHRNYKLELINSDENGANYHVSALSSNLNKIDLDIWLCNVTKYVFGDFPETIYLRVL